MSLDIGLVQISSELSWTRQRFKERTRRSPVRQEAPAPTQSWSIFPYSVGILEAYARSSNRGDWSFRPIISRPREVQGAPDALAGASLVGFSNYVWNERRSLEIARSLRERSPDTLIVFGGPQVPDDPTDWLAAHPWVDLTVHGEGEQAFVELLRAADAGSGWSDVPSVSWRRGGEVITNSRIPRLRELDALPSPYLEGVFDPLMNDPSEKWILLWETNRGCPFSCTFCDWGSATASKVNRFDQLRLERELEWFGQHDGEMIFCCDANFGILPRDVALAEKAAEVKSRLGFPRTLSVQNTKNSTERAFRIQEILTGAGMQAGVTLSLQSLDQATLVAVDRANISLDSFLEIQRRFRAKKIPTYTDVILALPGESYESFANGVSRLIEGGQHDRVQFYNCAILPNAPMARPEYRARYGLRAVSQSLIANHVTLSEADDGERIDVVVETAAMPAADWRRAKAFTWYTDLLYYDRMLALPFVSLNVTAEVPYRTLIEAIMNADADRYQLLGEIRHRFDAHARAIQGGEPEPVPSEQWLGIWWPPDQYLLIDLVTTFRTEQFYAEAGEVLCALARAVPGADERLVSEALRLNQALFTQPFEIDDCEMDLERDPYGVYVAGLAGGPVPGEAGVAGRIVRTEPTWLDWDTWFEHMIFCHNQKSSYWWPWHAMAGVQS
jgi:radical SAM superfamily enzyme YgiQ (UPF0313 family)